MFENPSTTPEVAFDYETEINEFLGETERDIIGDDSKIKELEEKSKKESFENIQKLESGRVLSRLVSYDKYKKNIMISGEATTAGKIVASRHFGTQISLPKELDNTLAGKTLRKKYFEYTERDFLNKNLNAELARKLVTKYEKLNSDKSKAYTGIAEREEGGSRQEGAIAEKMIIGVIEMISIDRPDLNIEVRGANAYQDVEEKIDFVITTKEKRRAVGIEEKDETQFEEKNFGIQFTINTSKKEFKEGQIQKVKDRGHDMEDILYVEIDQKIIHEALGRWENNNKPISGPWEFLNKQTKVRAIENLFQNILPEDKIKSLVDKI